ncbi:hypothetical protein HPHPA4_1604 [Helicobacter pylori Hp A-4]|nr:hypothetical protein HPHPA4_1604 [Helicobacter pylori Hp A-4]
MPTLYKKAALTPTQGKTRKTPQKPHKTLKNHQRREKTITYTAHAISYHPR